MWRALGAVLAATAGTAFLSGRQLTLFFSQLGGMSWLAVGTASALFGLCCGALCRFARQTGGENVAAVLMRRLQPGLAFISQIVQDSPIERLHFRFHALTKARTPRPAFVRQWIPD